MSTRFGRCVNQDFCSLAAQKAVLRLDDGELFVCPECARPLAATKAWDKGGANRAAMARLLPPLGITAIGAAGIVFGLRHPEVPRPPAPKAAVHAQKPRAVAVVKKSAPAKPLRVAVLPPPPPPPDRVLLLVNAAPPLNTMLLPQLAAGFLALGRDAPASIATVDGRIRIAMTTEGPTQVILVKEAGFDAASMQSGAADLACTDKPPADAERQQAGVLTEMVVGAMPADPRLPVICYARPAGRAADFAAFLATDQARQIVATAGYAAPPPPPPAAKPAAKTVEARAKPEQPGAVQTAVPVAAKMAAKAAAKAAGKAAANQPAAGADQPAAGTEGTDEASGTPAGPRIVHVAPGAGMTLDGLKAMMSPGTAPATANSGSDTAAKPRHVFLPADARLTIGAYRPVNIPDQPAKLYFVRPEATHRPGSVKVDCKIDTTGLPTDCRELAHEGTAEAAAAILAWLPSGAIRYSPVMKNGHAVAERRVLTVNFGAPKPVEKLDDAEPPAPAKP